VLAVIKRTARRQAALRQRAPHQIIAGEGEIDLESLIREEDMVISISHTGYVKRLALSAYRQQKRGGVGVMAAQANDDDWMSTCWSPRPTTTSCSSRPWARSIA